MDSDIKKNKPINAGLKVLLNLIAIIASGIVLIWLGPIWLDVWTNHGEYKVVPDVRRLPYSEAVERLSADGFIVELSDSVYDDNAGPGVVTEQNPKMNTKVKEGRTVYLTVNAFSPRSVTIPSLTDMSLRQARSILEGLGIKNITVSEVPSEYRDLVLAVKRDGRTLMPGARIPATSKLVIEVGTGLQENNGDSIIIDNDSTDFLNLN